MKNTLSDLNNHLFAEMERLSDEEITGEALEEELNRAKAVSNIASQIINNGKLVLEAVKFKDDQMNIDIQTPQFLIGAKKDEKD